MTPELWNKAETLYRAALDRAPSERDAFLEKACGDDEALLDEVRSRLVATWVGRRVQSYEVLSLLGAGGMGEVYRAKDTKLGREVALKVLSEEFADDAERVTRFEREARLLAALNHPNVAAIHGLEESEGRHVLVLELVEGETLAERIVRGPIPVPEALPLFRQIAAGLEAAHEKGIVHRDLKPANVTVTPEGQVKVLDFGLAKAFRGVVEAGSDIDTASAWESQTAEGRILGTVSYMSPEQARGQAVDKRTDVWAFGCVLYEALTGRRAFAGGTITDTLAAVLDREVDWERLPAGTPAGLRSLLRRCLQKDRDRRLHDIADARIEIEEALAEPSRSEAASAVAQRSPELREPTLLGRWRWRREHLAWLGMGVFAVAALLLATRPFGEAPPQVAPVRLSVVPPPDTEFSLVQMALAPDGETLAFVAITEGGRRLLGLRALNALEPRVLVDTEGGLDLPFWSPDSRFIAFFSEGKLKRIRASGGPTETVSDVLPRPSAYWKDHYLGGGSWSRDGVIILGSEEGILRVDAAGGTPAPVTKLDAARQEFAHVHPHILPDGRRFLFLARSRNDEKSGIYVGSLDGADTTRVLSTRVNAVYAPPEHLLFAHQGALSAVPFDRDALKVTGDPVLVAEEVRSNLQFGRAGLSASDNGVLAFHGGSAGTPLRPVWVDRRGNELASIGPAFHHHRLRLSPDEGRLALAQIDHQSGESDVWLHEFSRDLTSRFTFSGPRDPDPVWSPDGGRIAYSRRKLETYAIVRKSVGGGEVEDVLFESNDPLIVDDWARDGRTLLYESRGDIYLLPLADSREATPLLSTPHIESDGRFSPDGRSVAYCSDETGRTEVYVTSMAAGHKQQISNQGGRRPRWRGDGKELFYVDANNMLMAAGVGVDSSPVKVGTPRELFRSGLRLSCSDYAPSSTGEKFLIGRPVEDLPASAITVVLNWTAGLE